tara:strand:- start:60 stop:536 length:477 start_codon:yes stop_codon:yes gene_type:complete
MIKQLLRKIRDFLCLSNLYDMKTFHENILFQSESSSIETMNKDFQHKLYLLQQLSQETQLSQIDIDEYIDSISLFIISDETSTLKIQIKQLHELLTNPTSQQEMIDIIHEKKFNQKNIERINAEYRTALYHLREKKIYPDISMSKIDVIHLYKSRTIP